MHDPVFISDRFLVGLVATDFALAVPPTLAIGLGHASMGSLLSRVLAYAGLGRTAI